MVNKKSIKSNHPISYNSDALKMLKKVSDELFSRNIHHKVEKNSIKTRKSKTNIPKLNKDVAYLLGVIEGDGSLNISKRKRGGYHYLLRIYSGDMRYIKYLQLLINKLFLIKTKVRKDKRKESSYYLKIENAPLFFYFASLGSEVGKKCKGTIPKIVERNKTYASHYLAGLVDTDGSIYGKRIQLKQKRKNLINNINELRFKLGIDCSSQKINYTNNFPFYYIRFDNKIPLRYKINNFLNQKK